MFFFVFFLLTRLHSLTLAQSAALILETPHFVSFILAYSSHKDLLELGFHWFRQFNRCSKTKAGLFFSFFLFQNLAVIEEGNVKIRFQLSECFSKAGGKKKGETFYHYIKVSSSP